MTFPLDETSSSPYVLLSNFGGAKYVGCNEVVVGNSHEDTGIVNPPKQEEVVYRAGDYASFMERMLMALPETTLTKGPFMGTRPLSHLVRDAHSPAIALLDGWAMMLDILSFYMERMQNEAYVRTCTQKVSTSCLLTMLGSQIRPGLAATTVLAFTLKNTPVAKQGVQIPQGVQVQSLPSQGKKSQIFETDNILTAFPDWNKETPIMQLPYLIDANTESLCLQGVATGVQVGDVVALIGQERIENAASSAWCVRQVMQVHTDTSRLFTEIHLAPFLAKETAPITLTSPQVVVFGNVGGLFGGKAPDFSQVPLEIKRKYGVMAGGLYGFSTVENRWNMIGQGTGAAVIRSIYVNSKGYVFLATNQGVLRSLNGKAWGMANQGINVLNSYAIISTFVEEKESRTEWMFVGTETGLFASQDYGLHWQLVTEGLQGGPVLSLAKDSEGTLYAGTAQGVFYSTDHGVSWTASLTTLSAVHAITVSSKSVLYAATDKGVWTSSSQGKQWQAFNQGMEDVQVTCLLQQGTVLFAGTVNGIWRSSLSKPVWKLANQGLENSVVMSLATDKNGALFAGTQSGLFCSTDNGDQWFFYGLEKNVVQSLALFPDGKISAGAYVVTPPKQWPNFKIQNNQLDLESYVPKIMKGSWVLLVKDSSLLLAKASDVRPVARQDFMLKAMVTRITPDVNIDPLLFDLRQTMVYGESAPLTPIPRTVTDPVQGNHLLLGRIIPTMEAGRTVVLQGKRTRVQFTGAAHPLLTVSGTTAYTLLPEETVQVVSLKKISDAETVMLFIADNGCTGSITVSPAEYRFVAAKPADETVSEVLYVEDVTVVEPGVTALSFTTPLTHIYDRTTLMLYGNVVSVTQGETVKEVLGSGSSGKQHQQFSLSKTPVLTVPSVTPPGYQNTLSVYVNKLAWQEVDTLFDQTPHSECYTAGYDHTGKVTITFGDGEHGSTLPDGSHNVEAIYKVGDGGEGNVPAQAITMLKKTVQTAGSSLLGGTADAASFMQYIDKVTNPLPVTNGISAKTIMQETLIEAANLQVCQSIVSLEDFEKFARHIQGVLQANAVCLWDEMLHQQQVVLTVATDEKTDSCALVQCLRTRIKASLLSSRLFEVVPYQPEYVTLALRVTFSSHVEDPDARIRTCKTLLQSHFSLAHATFLKHLNASDIVAFVQKAVDGVVAVTLKAFHKTGEHPAVADYLTPRAAAIAKGVVMPAGLLLLNPAADGIVIEQETV